MLLTIDGMDQAKTKLPHQVRNSKDTDHYPGIGVHALSVFVFGGLVPIIGFLNLPDIEKNSSLTVTSMHRAIQLQYNAQFATHGKLVNWPPWLAVFFDNARGENMNHNVFVYLAWLVHIGVFREITITTLLVGHTHNINDQVFSVWSRSLNSNNCYSLEQMMELFKKYTGSVKNVAEPKTQELVVCPDGDQSSYYIHPDTSAPDRRSLKKSRLVVLRDIDDAVAKSSPFLEQLEQTASIESWIGSTVDRKATSKISDYHVFKLVKNSAGQTQLYLKFLHESELTYPEVPHEASHAGVAYRAVRTMLEADAKMDSDPIRLPYVPYDTSSLRKQMAQLVLEKALDQVPLDQLTKMCDRLDTQTREQLATCAVCIDLLDKQIDLMMKSLPKEAMKAQRDNLRQNREAAQNSLAQHALTSHADSNCTICSSIAERRNNIGVLHEPSHDAPAAERERHALAARLRAQLSAALTLHLTTSLTDEKHKAQFLTGWWTNWTRDRVPVIHALWRTRGILDVVEHNPGEGLLAHPRDITRDETYDLVRTEQTCFDAVGEPTVGMIGIFRCQRQEGRPPFWLGKLIEYLTPSDDMSDMPQETKECEVSRPVRRNKDKLATPRSNIFSRSHLRVKWFNHIEPAAKPVPKKSSKPAAKRTQRKPGNKKTAVITAPGSDDMQESDRDSDSGSDYNAPSGARKRKRDSPAAKSCPLIGAILPEDLEQFKDLSYVLMTEEASMVSVSTLAWWGPETAIYSAKKRLLAKAFSQIVRDLSQDKTTD